jgi:uncharacterized protein YndB with AHSA1/START domain
MSVANQSRFVYVTYIRTTPARLWEALTDPQIIQRYRFNSTIESAWKKDAPWKLSSPDRGLMDSGRILEIDPVQRIVIHWQNEWKPEFKAEGPSRCTIDLEPLDNAVRLTVTHEINRPESEFIAAASIGWPMVLSNLKSLLETGQVVIKSPGH